MPIVAGEVAWRSVSYSSPQAQNAWYRWNDITATATGNAIYIPSETTVTYGTVPPTSTWTYWTTATITSTTTTPMRLQAWGNWNEVANGWVESAEQQEARQRRLDEMQAERERASRERLAKAKKYAGAQERALQLLEMVLTPEEKLLRDQHNGDIYVRGSEGGLYVIELRNSVHGNVRKVDEHGCELGRLCAAPRMYDEINKFGLPLADGWVGQLLTLKHNEAHFVQKANWSRRQECRVPDVPILGQQQQRAA